MVTNSTASTVLVFGSKAELYLEKLDSYFIFDRPKPERKTHTHLGFVRGAV